MPRSAGTIVINNPFWWTADDKFFNYALASKLGVAIPPTVILPHHKHPEGTTDQSMRNLIYPLNWEEIFDYVRLPCFSQAVFRRRMEACLQGAFAGRIFPSLQPDRRPVHDPAARRQVQRILPLLRGRAGKSSRHALRSQGAASRALCEESSAGRSQADRPGCEGLRRRCAGRWATT